MRVIENNKPSPSAVTLSEGDWFVPVIFLTCFTTLGLTPPLSTSNTRSLFVKLAKKNHKLDIIF